MDGIMKINKSLEESGLLKNVSAKKQKDGFLGMLLGTLGANVQGNLLTDKGTIRASEEIC